jgi:hypothetical protein
MIPQEVSQLIKCLREVLRVQKTFSNAEAAHNFVTDRFCSMDKATPVPQREACFEGYSREKISRCCVLKKEVAHRQSCCYALQ